MAGSSPVGSTNLKTTFYKVVFKFVDPKQSRALRQDSNGFAVYERSRACRESGAQKNSMRRHGIIRGRDSCRVHKQIHLWWIFCWTVGSVGTLPYRTRSPIEYFFKPTGVKKIQSGYCPRRGRVPVKSTKRNIVGSKKSYCKSNLC